MSFDAVMFAVLGLSILLNVWWGRFWWVNKTRRWLKAWYIARN